MSSYITYDDFWSVMLLIENPTKDRFIVRRKLEDENLQVNRWELPWAGGNSCYGNPDAVCMNLATSLGLCPTYEELKLLLCAQADDFSSLYLFIHDVSTPESEQMFSTIETENSGQGEYFALAHWQAALNNSGLDTTQREFLLDAGIIEWLPDGLLRTNGLVCINNPNLTRRQNG
jgi:hypothetical protein